MSKILIGKITSPHGIKGALKLISFCEKNDDIFKYKNIFDKNNNLIKITKLGKLNNDLFIIQIENITNRNQADLLKDMEFFIERDELENLDENNFYITDLIGLKVINEENIEDVGLILDVLNFGANDMFEVKWSDNSIETIPVTDQFIKKIDLENKLIYIEKPTYI